MGLAEFAGYAILLYYLPATVNHISGQPWTALRLVAAISAGMVYFILGAVYLLTGFLVSIAVAAALVFILSLAVILVGIVHGIPLIKRGSTRTMVLLVTLLTITFLPLVMIGWLLDGSGQSWEISGSLRFLFLTLYYFLMALSGIVFYLKEMTDDEQNQSHGNIRGKVDISLSPRESYIANSITKGHTYREIAEELSLSTNTVRNHVANVYKKLSVRSKIELMGVMKKDQSSLV